MSNDCLQYQFDEITMGGLSLRVESDTITIDSASGYEMEPVPAAKGTHGYTMKRVTPTVKLKLMTDNLSLSQIGDMDAFLGMGEQQFVGRDSISGRRVRAAVTVWKKIGELGKGAMDCEVMLLSKLQWL